MNAAAGAAKDETPWTAGAYETALLAADARRPVEQTAPLSQRRAVRDSAALAAPSQMPATPPLNRWPCTASLPAARRTSRTFSQADPLSHPQAGVGLLSPRWAGSGGNGEAGAPGVLHDSPPEPPRLPPRSHQKVGCGQPERVKCGQEMLGLCTLSELAGQRPSGYVPRRLTRAFRR
jgi:hypothetical protein